MSDPYLLSALFILIYVILCFFIAQIMKNNGLMDIAWGLGFVGICWLMYFRFGYPGGVLLPLAVTVYGLRLSIHLFLRNWGQKEDWRYAKWRREWGKNVVIRAFFQVFLLQGSVMWVIALPLLPVENNPVEMHQNFLLYVGFALWLTGFLWESIADWQLMRFKKKPENQGKIMQQGLWAHSRHPNYFGEILLWWGIFLLALPHSVWWISILSPLLLTWLLNRVSGVPMLESKYRDHPEYAEYRRKTNALIPKF